MTIVIDTALIQELSKSKNFVQFFLLFTHSVLSKVSSPSAPQASLIDGSNAKVLLLWWWTLSDQCYKLSVGGSRAVVPTAGIM